jgi:prolyl-tRNA synthetase
MPPGKKKENEDGMTIRKAEDFGRWYSELVVKSEMIDYSDISGVQLRPAKCILYPCVRWQTGARSC